MIALLQYVHSLLHSCSLPLCCVQASRAPCRAGQWRRLLHLQQLCSSSPPCSGAPPPQQVNGTDRSVCALHFLLFCMLGCLVVKSAHQQQHFPDRTGPHLLCRVAIVDFDVHHGNGTQVCATERGGRLVVFLDLCVSACPGLHVPGLHTVTTVVMMFSQQSAHTRVNVCRSACVYRLSLRMMTAFCSSASTKLATTPWRLVSAAAYQAQSGC